VSNTGSSSGSFILSVSCHGPVTSCAVSGPITVPLSAHSSTTKTVTYQTTAAGGTATVALIARNQSSPFNSDSGYVSVLVHAYTVSVTPDSASKAMDPGSGSYTFLVHNSGNAAGSYAIAVTGCTGVVVGTCNVLPTSLTLQPNTTDSAIVTFSAMTRGTSGAIQVSATHGSYTDAGSLTVNANPVPVAVTPDGQAVTAPGGLASTQSFTLQNTTTTTDFRLRVDTSCSGSGIVAGSCVASADGVFLPRNSSVTVAVSYRTPSAAASVSGVVALRVTDAATGELFDSGYVNITVPVGTAPVVDVASTSPGANIERDLCLTFALRPHLASECGVVRITHPLPGIRTFNKARAPTLIYYSDQVQPGVLAANVTVPAGITPDSVQMTVYERKADGSLVDRWSRTYAGSAWTTTGRTQRLAASPLPFNGTELFRYRVEVRLRVSGAWQAAVAAEGEMPVVDRRGSAFGGGWWLAGLERVMQSRSDTLFWIGGDGSTRRYVSQHAVVGGDTVYLADPIVRADTLLRVAAGGYRRLLPNALRVEFDGAGRHVRTINRLSDTTRFVWSTSPSPQLDSIIVPGARAYTFAYSNGLLTQIAAPRVDASHARNVVLMRKTVGGVQTARIDSIIDPDGSVVRFSYPTAADTLVISGYTDQRGTRTDLTYETASPTLAAASTPIGGSRTVTHQFRTVTGLGAAPSAAPIPVDSAYTRYDGPRIDSADVTKFWLDRYGAPTTIVDAHGATTRLSHGDARWPGLVTRVRGANGHVVSAAYDQRGNIATMYDRAPFGDGRDAVTRYHWHVKWDEPDSVITPMGVVTTFGYNATTGNREYDQLGPNPARRTAYYYYDNGRFKKAILPRTAPDSVSYDSLWNVNAYVSPKGAVTTYVGDSLGRDTLVATEFTVDKLGTRKRMRVRHVFDIADREKRTETIGETIGGTVEGRLIVVQTYDSAGNRLSLTRSQIPDPSNTGDITTQWTYDAIGRVIAEKAPDGRVDSTHYDLAGNVDTIFTRRYDPADPAHRLKIVMTYDAVNRLTTRVTDGLQYASRRTPWTVAFPQADTINYKMGPYPLYPNTSGGGYAISADTATFRYDVVGDMLLADNRDARVHRQYYPNGQLWRDSLYIRTVAPLDSGGDIDQTHRYGLRFSYDLDGRRTVIQHPSALAAGAADSTRYAYDPVTGELTSVWSLRGKRFDYEYTMRGEIARIVAPDSAIDEARAYDQDGGLDTMQVSVGGVAQMRLHVLRNERGQLLWSGDEYGWVDTTTAAYSSLGQLVERGDAELGRTFNGNTGVYSSAEGFTYDPLGNIITNHNNTNAATVEGGSPIGVSWRTSWYTPGVGRLDSANVEYPAVTVSSGRTDRYEYDEAGNMTVLTQQAWYGYPTFEDRVSYYGADGKVRAADNRTFSEGNSAARFAFEEYRYDALGRRIWTRAKRWCAAVRLFGECRLGYVRRTIWDGVSELWEIQMPGNPGTPADTMENDVSPVKLAPTSSPYMDLNPYFGRVVYTHGLELDQPLALTRFGYADWPQNQTYRSDWQPVTMVPWWDVRGHVSGVKYRTAEGCLTLSPDRCMNVYIPNAWFAYGRAGVVPSGWQGTLLNDKEDATGTFYRRAREYDPITGRFTQEDPIGLAGGMNMYGFAAGDPVDYADPFGLSADSLHYDGTYLTWYDDNGKEVGKWRATSGRPGSTAADQELASSGPIPEGTYTIDPGDTFHVGNFWDWLKLGVATGFADYGSDRAPLTRVAGTAGANRGHFWMHGGSIPGSAGCIDLGQNAADVFARIRAYHGKLTVGVAYPSASTVTTPPIHQPFVPSYPMGIP
jgi:RHS repeat-associated protein